MSAGDDAHGPHWPHNAASDHAMERILARLLHLRTDDVHEDALHIMLELGVRAVNTDEGSLLLLDRPTQDLVFVLTAGDMLSESALKGQRVAMGEGLTGMAAQTGEVQVGLPASVSVEHPTHHRHEPPTQLIAAPMRAGKDVVGVLTAAAYAPRRQFSTNQVRMFERVATLAGIVVAEWQRSRFGDDQLHRTSRASAGTSREDPALQLAELTQRIARGDEARLRALITLLQQIERLGAR